MQLNKKKELAARCLKVGKARIIFNKERLDEIKEAITKQDIRDLFKDKAIIIKEIRGRRTIVRRKTRRREGSIKKKVNKRKKEYMILTRKLRAYIAKLKKKGILTREPYRQLRKEIRTKEIRSLANMKERTNQVMKYHKEQKK